MAIFHISKMLIKCFFVCQVEQISGRVFFCSNADLYTVTQLKSAERLFLLLRKAEPISLPNNPGEYE